MRLLLSLCFLAGSVFAHNPNETIPEGRATPEHVEQFYQPRFQGEPKTPPTPTKPSPTNVGPVAGVAACL